MIESRPEPISENDQVELDKWFAKGQFSLLLKILDSKVKELQAKSANEAMVGGDGYTIKANITLEESRRFQNTKDTLIEIAQSKTRHSIVKLS